MKVRGWSGLTRAQARELDEALWLPDRRELPYVEAARAVHEEYAARTVALLIGNDLRGALSAAEIAYTANGVAERERASRHAALWRLQSSAGHTPAPSRPPRLDA